MTGGAQSRGALLELLVPDELHVGGEHHEALALVLVLQRAAPLLLVPTAGPSSVVRHHDACACGLSTQASQMYCPAIRRQH